MLYQYSKKPSCNLVFFLSLYEYLHKSSVHKKIYYQVGLHALLSIVSEADLGLLQHPRWSAQDMHLPLSQLGGGGISEKFLLGGVKKIYFVVGGGGVTKF